ncbi:MAG: hypothetical protein E7463_12970 [Ruminococcaceae bacterium]|nr:hypothetical protein [Oscillospiraceae bacterium]
MAKLETTARGNITELERRIQNGILDGSMSATVEDVSHFRAGSAQCTVMVFERYSYMGGNRVSLNVTLFDGGDGNVRISAITSGGSQAMFFKINTWGEEAFLDKLREIL